MIPHSDILFGESGQSLAFDAPEGVPSSVTSVQVFAMTGGDALALDALDAPALESVSTTFDADSGAAQADPTICNLAATASLAIGRSYLATDALGQTELVQVRAITSGASVRSYFPLALNYASGDAFASTRITAALDATWVADANNVSDDSDPNPGYRVRWEYVVSGKTYVHHTTMDLVRYAGETLVTPIDMESYYPNWADMLPSFHVADSGRRLIAQAYRDVMFDLHQIEVPDEQVRNPDVRDELVKLKTVARALRLRFYEGAASADQAELAQRDYQARLDALVRITNKTTIGVDSSGAGAKTPAVGIWSR